MNNPLDPSTRKSERAPPDTDLEIVRLKERSDELRDRSAAAREYATAAGLYGEAVRARSKLIPRYSAGATAASPAGLDVELSQEDQERRTP